MAGVARVRPQLLRQRGCARAVTPGHHAESARVRSDEERERERAASSGCGTRLQWDSVDAQRRTARGAPACRCLHRILTRSHETAGADLPGGARAITHRICPRGLGSWDSRRCRAAVTSDKRGKKRRTSGLTPESWREARGAASGYFPRSWVDSP